MTAANGPLTVDRVSELLNEFGDARESSAAAYECGDRLTMREKAKEATEARTELMRIFGELLSRSTHETSAVSGVLNAEQFAILSELQRDGYNTNEYQRGLLQSIAALNRTRQDEPVSGVRWHVECPHCRCQFPTEGFSDER